jgi:hypothetical protein
MLAGIELYCPLHHFPILKSGSIWYCKYSRLVCAVTFEMQLSVKSRRLQSC